MLIKDSFFFFFVSFFLMLPNTEKREKLFSHNVFIEINGAFFPQCFSYNFFFFNKRIGMLLSYVCVRIHAS